MGEGLAFLTPRGFRSIFLGRCGSASGGSTMMRNGLRIFLRLVMLTSSGR
jgi:hypothetical protein